MKKADLDAKVKSLDRKKIINLQGKAFTAPFPNVGQLIEIETNKIIYSDGKYSNLVRSNLIGSTMALDLIEAISYFTVLIPDFFTEFKIDILQLDIISSREIVLEYKKNFLPWYNEWIEVLRKFEEEEETEESSTN